MSRDTNFYYSFLVLPSAKRRAIVAVWDFCRAVDDAVDAPGFDPVADPERVTAELARWRREIASCFGASQPQTEQGRCLKPHIKRFNLPRLPFEDLIDGVEMDVGERRYETFDDLYEYCLRVASAVGLICIEIFGYRDASARDYAVALGIALQLTNIVRDIPTDLRNGRVYLPAEDLRRFNCTDRDLGDGRSSEVRQLVKFECDRARSYYRKARGALPVGDAMHLVAAEIMGGDLSGYPAPHRAAQLRCLLGGRPYSTTQARGNCLDCLDSDSGVGHGRASARQRGVLTRIVGRRTK